MNHSLTIGRIRPYAATGNYLSSRGLVDCIGKSVERLLKIRLTG
jgi:hypothetical protein